VSLRFKVSLNKKKRKKKSKMQKLVIAMQTALIQTSKDNSLRIMPLSYYVKRPLQTLHSGQSGSAQETMN